MIAKPTPERVQIYEASQAVVTVYPDGSNTHDIEDVLYIYLDERWVGAVRGYQATTDELRALFAHPEMVIALEEAVEQAARP